MYQKFYSLRYGFSAREAFCFLPAFLEFQLSFIVKIRAPRISNTLLYTVVKIRFRLHGTFSKKTYRQRNRICNNIIQFLLNHAALLRNINAGKFLMRPSYEKILKGRICT